MVFLVQWEAAMEVAVRALVIASGVVLIVGSIATAMPVYQPHLWQDTIQIHGCHHGYSHDLGGRHRHTYGGLLSVGFGLISFARRRPRV